MYDFFMCIDSFITFKDCFYLFIGVVLGLIVGIGIYYWPLGQFSNEWKALWNLVRYKYPRGTAVIVINGTDLKRVGVATYPNYLDQDKEMKVWHDEGVDWFHTVNGWQRVRVVQVFFDNDSVQPPPVYRICYLDIKKTMA